MPRPKKDGAAQAKTRSRNGCWPCKTRKVKCDERRPTCLNCEKQGEACDFSIRLNWEGRGKNKKTDGASGSSQSISSSNDNEHATSIAGMEVRSGGGVINFQDPSLRSVKPGTIPQLGDVQQYGGVTPGSLPANVNGSAAGSAFSPQIDLQTNAATPIDPLLLPPVSEVARETSFVPQMPIYQYSQSFEQPQWPQHSLPAMSSVRRLDESLVRSTSSVLSGDIESSRLPVSPNLPRAIPDSSIALSSSLQGGRLTPTDALSTDFLTESRSTKRLKHGNNDVFGAGRIAQLPPLFLVDKSLESHSHNTNHDSTSDKVPPVRSTSITPREGGSKLAHAALSPYSAQSSSDPRRLSVESLLSGPPGIPFSSSTPLTSRTDESLSTGSGDGAEQMTAWGIDRGFKDLDIGKNDDANAISGGSPVALREYLELAGASDMPNEFGFGVQAKDTAFEKGGYYARPVTIEIPRSFEPLPPLLLENPQNILYFHHFISHTARILVPHHCSSNPFQKILPRMALQDNDLLSLLLAYSASHRARLLQQPEPATRIALWVQDVFPNLRRSLDDPEKVLSNTNLASAIMLCSLEIISPKAFGVSVPWQNHLHTARQIIAARGGTSSMRRDNTAVSAFLLHWFGYLDVVGRLMGGHLGLPASPDTSQSLDYAWDDDDDYQIDCLLGFTGRCASILGRVAELARTCAAQRAEPDDMASDGWTPSEDIKDQGSRLLEDLELSRTNTRNQNCPHLHSAEESKYQWDNREIAATNESYHWAGSIHVHRRILGKPASHVDVQSAVREIIGTLYKVRQGSTAEACLLFPMFTAGCEAGEDRQRSLIMGRVKGVEELGMTQVYKARRLMERVWETGKPWEALAAGEFVG